MYKIVGLDELWHRNSVVRVEDTFICIEVANCSWRMSKVRTIVTLKNHVIVYIQCIILLKMCIKKDYIIIYNQIEINNGKYCQKRLIQITRNKSAVIPVQL